MPSNRVTKYFAIPAGPAEHTASTPASDATILIAGVIKSDGETYLISFRDSTRAEALRKVGQMATDSRLSFTWTDAAVLSQQIRSM